MFQHLSLRKAEHGFWRGCSRIIYHRDRGGLGIPLDEININMLEMFALLYLVNSKSEMLVFSTYNSLEFGETPFSSTVEPTSLLFGSEVSKVDWKSMCKMLTKPEAYQTK